MSDAYAPPKNLSQPTAAPDITQRIAQQVSASPGYQGLQPSDTSASIQPGSVWDKLAAINSGLYGSVPFISKILQNISPDTMKMLQEGAKRNPGLATAGTIGGSLAQGLEAPALGAGKLAGAATREIGNIVGRNALNAGVSALPNAIQQAAAGDIGGAAKNFGINLAAGTALGSATEGIMNKLPDILQGMKEWGQRRGIGSAGIQSRDLRGALKAGPLGKYKGSIINNADDEVNALWTTLKNTGAFGQQAQKRLFGDQGEVWEQLANGYNQAGIKLTDPTIRAGILADPNVQGILARTDIGTPQDIEASFDKILSGIDSGANYNAKKKIADEIIKRGFSPTVDAATHSNAQMASIIKSNIDDIAGTISPQLDVAGMKYDYHTMQPLFQALAREKAKITATEAGSPTAARVFTKQLLMGGGEGGAGGLLLGAATSGQDDPDRWKKILTTGIGGVLLGGAANKIIPNLVNKIGGQTVGRLSDLITPQAIEAISKGAQTLAPHVAPMIAKEPLGIVENAIQPANSTPGIDTSLGGPAQSPATPIIPPPVQGQTPAPPGAVPIPNAAPQLSPQEQAQIQFNPGKSPAAEQEFGPFNSSFVNARIDEKFNRYVQQYGNTMTRADYASAFKRATNNFNPDEPNTYKALFDDPATSDRLFKAHMGMKQLQGVNTEDILDSYTHWAHLGTALSGPDVLRRQEARTKFVNAFAGMTGQKTADIDKRLGALAWDKNLSAKEKQEKILEMLTDEGGIDIPQLHQMGLLNIGGQ